MTIYQRDWAYRFVSVMCPICGIVRLTRDAYAWRAHLINSHSAAGGMEASHWANTGIYGDDEGTADIDDEYIYRFPHKCYACGASFRTNVLLSAHITAVHLGG